MKILITGSSGFIGKNLITHLRELKDVEIITFDRKDTIDKIKDNINDVSYIFHLAGVNRPKNVNEFYEGNQGLTNQIIDILTERHLSIPIIITSSIQAALDNDYGKSKKLAEKSIMEYGNGSRIYRLHNVFGKWCRPNYNSVVATFCHNIANDLDISINDKNTEIELIYIDDVCREFQNIVLGKSKPQNVEYYSISPTYKATIGELANMIYEFKQNASSIYVPDTNADAFTKKLYSTYISYLPLRKLHTKLDVHADERGFFTELVRSNSCGQVSVSISKPGITRGNHYHHTKIERFMVIKGKAKITLTHIITGETYEIFVDGNHPESIIIPVGYTHAIENIGDDEMILLMWCNELFDNNKPDTYYKEVNKKEA